MICQETLESRKPAFFVINGEMKLVSLLAVIDMQDET